MNSTLTKLPILFLQPHARCDCRCVMCDIWKIANAEEITLVELERHSADIVHLGVESVVFTGGEPLMHSDLFRLSALLRDRGIRTTIFSSGLLLERYAAAIAQNIDDAIVSLDGPPFIHDGIRGVPGAFERLASGVRALHRISPHYRVAARCTVQARNAPHLRAAIQTARELGLCSISFQAADLSSSSFNRPQPWPEERRSEIAPNIERLTLEVESIIDDYARDRFVLESPAKLRRIVDHNRAHFGLQAYTAPKCNAPWVSAVVDTDGNVRPCFFNAPFGNISGTTLEAVVNGPQAVAFRETLNVQENSICQRCVSPLSVQTPMHSKEKTRTATQSR